MVPIDKVVFTREVAMFLVQLWFIVSVLNLCINCWCMDIAKPAFDVQRDCENIQAIQKGTITRDAAPEITVGSMAHAAVGRYSGEISRKRVSLMVLIAVTICVDALRLYYRSNDVDANLSKRFGVEYTFWKMVTQQGVD